MSRMWYKVARNALAACVLAMVAYYTYQHFRDDFRYGSSRIVEPLQLGDASSVRLDGAFHNKYVCLEGITEHRSVKQRVFMAIPYPRVIERWYFRILGGRGLFVQTPADKASYGPTTSLHVCGRLLVPTVGTTDFQYFDQFFAHYCKLFDVPAVGERPAVLQVDYKPWDYAVWRMLFPIAMLGAIGSYVRHFILALSELIAGRRNG